MNDLPESLTTERAKVAKLTKALQALLATLPRCTFTVHTDPKTGEETQCSEPATATLEGPHDQSWEMCVAHATEVKNAQPYPHRYCVCPREDLVAAIGLVNEALT